MREQGRRQQIGPLLRRWRESRRLSQLQLSLQANISARHLSFVETGRSAPSREMILHLAEELEVPLRERNTLLLAGGFAPTFSETPFDSPRLSAVRAAVRQVLAGHEPYPALVVDRHWNLIEGNAAVTLLTDGVAPELLERPANVLRVGLHPDGLVRRIANLGEWRAHLLHRLRRQVDSTADPYLASLYEELRTYPGDAQEAPRTTDEGEIGVPLRLRHAGGELAFFSVVSVFGTPLDITVAELAIESFFPADRATAAALHALESQRQASGDDRQPAGRS
jgi:transcriptional regulator with XRE-family HTH domain